MELLRLVYELVALVLFGALMISLVYPTNEYRVTTPTLRAFVVFIFIGVVSLIIRVVAEIARITDAGV